MVRIGSNPVPQEAGAGLTVAEKPIKVEILKGRDEICNFIREDPRYMCSLVENDDLPAWKRSETGPWYALNIDLYQWMVVQRNKYLKDTPKHIARMLKF